MNVQLSRTSTPSFEASFALSPRKSPLVSPIPSSIQDCEPKLLVSVSTGGIS